MEFGHDTEFDDMVCNEWYLYHRNSVGRVDLVVGKTFNMKDDLMNANK